MGSVLGEIETRMGEDEACSFAMALSTGLALPMVLKAVIELNVFEIIKQAGSGVHLSPTEIVAQFPTKNPNAATMLNRMLRLLASHSILSYSLRTLLDGRVKSLYGLAPVCQFFTKNDDGVTLGAYSLMNPDKVFMDSWYHLKDAVLDGGVPFNKACGMSLFEYNETDPRFSKLFNNAMSNHSTITVKKILENYKGFEGLSTLVDVGGGIGATLDMIISQYTTIKGINFDLPRVIDVAPLHNVEHIGGDMFVGVPKGDAIFMKWICHDWNDEHCLKILTNCYAALPDHGKVIVCEYILPVVPETNHAAQTVFHMDVSILTQTSGGKERTEQEFEALAKGSGFKGFRVACSAYDTKVMEFLK